MTSHCKACEDVDNDDMVQCDACDDWFHYTCVGVDNSVQDREWSCEKCRPPPTEKVLNPSGSAMGKNPSVEPNLLAPAPPNRSITPERTTKVDKQISSSKKRSLLLQRLDEERAMQEKRDNEFLRKKYAILDDILSSSESEGEDTRTQKKAEMAAKSVSSNPDVSSQSHPSIKNTSIYNSPHGEANLFNTSIITEGPLPTKQQMAARQIMSRENVTFSGRIEEWPRFISWFNSTTISCGYTNCDNLRRLQNALKGDAFKTVGIRLFFPEQVPGVLKSLHQLYGRPEDIIDDLIDKIRKEPSPKIDKLQSIIQFSLTVQNACAIMAATGMHDHLTNPSLVREFVEKLPPQIRLEWGGFRKSISSANLITFSDWLAEIASSASQVTRMNSPSTSISRTDRNPTRSAINFHSDSDPRSSDTKKCPVCNSNCNSCQNCQKFLSLNLNEKWNAIKRHNICRTCLRQHGRTRCRLEQNCGVDGCTYKHNKLLHKLRDMPSVSSPVLNEVVNFHQLEMKKCILFRIVPVTLYNGALKINTFAFLDDGSSISLLDEALATKLGISGETKPLCLKWTANTHRLENTSKIVNMKISPIHSNKKYDITNVRTVKSLDLPTQDINVDTLSNTYPHLKGIPLTSYSNAKPQILLGLDQWKLTIPLRSREGLNDQPAASKSRLGWTVYGPCKLLLKSNDREKQKFNFHICDCQQKENENLCSLFKEFISIDTTGPRTKTVLRSSDDEKAIARIKNTITKEGKHFVVPLLWKDEKNIMPDSRPMAVRRLIYLEKRMEKDRELYKRLNTQIQEYIQKNYARKLTQTELNQHFPRIWYLPIFPVVNKNKPDKIRMVWDAAAAVNGVSLNSMLLSGPDIVPSLVSILFRFRERNIAICADIKEMFHQVKIKKSDQHAQRFLWRNEQSKEIEEYIMKVMTFGSTCSPFCAQYAKNENARCYEKKFPRAVKAILENHYVDDYLDSFDTEEEAMQVTSEVIYIHEEGGLVIRNFLSNSQVVLNSLKEKSASHEKAFGNWSNLSGPEKILGMWWSPLSDSFSFAIKANLVQVESFAEEAWPTKRELLKTLMTVFDPLGLIANFLVLLKILLQEVWSSAIGWDEKIFPMHLEKWRRWISLIPEIKQIMIERPYAKQLSINSYKSVQMHIFVDASELAYAAVGYFRFVDGDLVKIVLVAAKTKVAPLKVISIPRLELEAALLGVRLAKIITAGHSIKISERYFWSDSRTVLSWINSDHRKFKQFVAFRVGEILEETEAKNWRWIPSKINVADEGTKWQSHTKFQSGSRWYQGPSFLYEPIEQWPKEFKQTDSSLEEIRHIYMHHVTKFENIIDVSRFSKWQRLLRTLAQVFRYIRRSSYKRTNSSPERHLVSMDFAKAENYCFSMCQNEAFPEEIAALTRSKEGGTGMLQVDRSSELYKLSPYLDENSILRVKGRIDAAYGVSLDTKRPIILQNGHYITDLIISAYHERFCHGNDETVINELRQRFFIPRLRAYIPKIKRKCQICKNNKCVPKPPVMGDLPQARLQAFTRPFSYIGIDYFGPLYVKVGRHSEKRWGVLITCLTVRAVHVEITCSLSTDSCLMALNRFIARRGRPLEIFSDNGTNFRGASNELREAIQQINVEHVADNFTSANLKWNFIPPASPHMGGSWERLVRSVKKTLNCIIPTRKPTDELLLTMLAEVERVVNARPLTYVPLGNENEEALTPNHFLLGSSNGNKNSGELCDDGILLRKNWLIGEQFANRFWKRWVNEYLPDLTRRTKWYSPMKQIQEGDVVVIADPENPRNCWPKGIVIQTFAGKDGNIRSAAVKTATGTYTRPTVKLAVLDVSQLGENVKPTHGTALPGGSVAKAGST